MEKITLVTGREVILEVVEQIRVYEGLLEGLPTREMNRRFVTSLRNRIASFERVAVHLIPPTERALQIRLPGGEPYPLGEPAILPTIACVGRFRSRTPARSTEPGYSELSVIWFQDEFPFPIAPAILEELRHLDWENLARDCVYKP